MPTARTTIKEIGNRLQKLKKEASAIWQDELALKAREKLGANNMRGEIHRPMGREEKCFREIRAARMALQELCGHENRKWVGQDWFCRDCGKIQYGDKELQTN